MLTNTGDIQLVVFDMAGTTVHDAGDVLECFRRACRAEGIWAADARLNALMGVSKLEVFHILWREQLGEGATNEEVTSLADRSFLHFRDVLETYYRTEPVFAVPGAEDVFAWLRERGINVALNTGFYRAVTDIILERLGWLDAGLVDFVVASDEVPRGRPAPDMIRRAMEAVGVADPANVVKIGDTPVDIEEGRQAGCGLVLAVTNGSHQQHELEACAPDALLASVDELPAFLQSALQSVGSVA